MDKGRILPCCLAPVVVEQLGAIILTMRPQRRGVPISTGLAAARARRNTFRSYRAAHRLQFCSCMSLGGSGCVFSHSSRALTIG